MTDRPDHSPDDDQGSILDLGGGSASEDHPDPVRPPPSRRGHRARRGGSGCLPLLVIGVVVVVAAVVLVPRAVSRIKDGLSDSAADYPGPGTGQVCFTVEPGDSLTATGQALQSDGIVASSKAFTQAADGASIQEGSFELKKMMKASDVVADLQSSKAAGCLTSLTILAGHTEADTIDLLAQATDFSKQKLAAAAKQTDRLGLPDYADGNPEGYLAPGQYQVQKGDTPLSLLQQMTGNFGALADQVDLVDGAQQLGYTPGQVVIVASLLQKEVGNPKDMAKVARVIYNRLQHPGENGTAGYLQLDSTINYVLKRGGFDLTAEDLSVDSPYNTRTHKGLPPGPINSPGADALNAALHPTPGPWFYYVTTNPNTQKTKFAVTFAQFQKYEAEFQRFCSTHPKVC